LKVRYPESRRRDDQRNHAHRKACGASHGLYASAQDRSRYLISGADSTSVLVLFFSAFAFSEQPAPSPA
jgi:hypothetical protein